MANPERLWYRTPYGTKWHLKVKNSFSENDMFCGIYISLDCVTLRTATKEERDASQAT